MVKNCDVLGKRINKGGEKIAMCWGKELTWVGRMKITDQGGDKLDPGWNRKQ